jgi:hypothetical protein
MAMKHKEAIVGFIMVLIIITAISYYSKLQAVSFFISFLMCAFVVVLYSSTHKGKRLLAILLAPILLLISSKTKQSIAELKTKESTNETSGKT